MMLIADANLERGARVLLHLHEQPAEARPRAVVCATLPRNAVLALHAYPFRIVSLDCTDDNAVVEALAAMPLAHRPERVLLHGMDWERVRQQGNELAAAGLPVLAAPFGSPDYWPLLGGAA